MKTEELKLRTKKFALRVIRLSGELPKSDAGSILGRQILRSGTSVGANYRSACRARSKPDFISKVGIAVEEADETAYWLELMTESGLFPAVKLESLLAEANELTAILNASMLTARKNQQSAIKNPKS